MCVQCSVSVGEEEQAVAEEVQEGEGEAEQIQNGQVCMFVC